MVKKNNKAWIVSVNMGYGHQRTAYALKDFAQGGGAIIANDYLGIPKQDKEFWELSRNFYEFISNFKKTPLIGDPAFKVFDFFQRIPEYYPKRDLSKPVFSLNKIFSYIEKGWGKDLIDKLRSKPLPLISTFFTPAFMAEYYDYPGEIYCVICDADISRPWASLKPKKSRIKYFAPNMWAYERLKMYGVREKNIYFTGYPLPLENIGTKKMEILKSDMADRIFNLDPKKEYMAHYSQLVLKEFGKLPIRAKRPLTILFSIGGAGAQKEIAMGIIKSLKGKLLKNELKIIISAGSRPNVLKYFQKELKKNNLARNIGSNIEIIFSQSPRDYFDSFNKTLRITDILWTKPSELCFYSGLGIPIIMAPTVGSQEDFNKKWLMAVGSAVSQETPKYASQWLYDHLNSGRLSEAAVQGYFEIEKLGAYKIKEIALRNLVSKSQRN